MKFEQTSDIFQKTTIRLLSRLEKITETSAKSKVMYVTSAGDGEGKSFVAASIAAHAAAMTDNRVLLIDGNMENPSLHQYFDVPPIPGFSDALRSSDWQNISCLETSIENLFVLPAGSQRRAGLLFKQHVVGEFLEAVKSRFDLVIFDSASIIRSGANSVVNLADGIVVVIDASSTRKQVLSYALSELAVDDEKIIGAVLNKKIRYIPGFIYKRA
jgi:capsular exopolysaccharide synthesis family protein